MLKVSLEIMLPAFPRLSLLYQRSQVAFLQRCYKFGSKINLTRTPNVRTFTGKNAWEIDTNVAKDVVLYSYDNAKFHKYLNFFAITQLGFWLYLAEFAMSTLRDVPVDKKELDPNAHWYQKINLGENKYRRAITTMCIAVGKFQMPIDNMALSQHSSFQAVFSWVAVGCILSGL